MKVAYIFRGHSRTWDKCHKNFFKNIFSVVPGDIFIHTWDSNNSIFGSHWNGYNSLNEDQLKISIALPNFNKIYNTYKPKIFITEPDKCKNIKNQPDNISSRLGLQYMLDSSKKLYNEVVNYDNYDFIFETRLDVNYTSKLDLTEFDSKNLVCPIEHNIMDFWFCGSIDNMKTKMDFCDKDHSINYEVALENYLRGKGISWSKSSLIFDVPRLF